MKSRWFKIGGAALAVIAITATVQAAPITGGIAITGNYQAYDAGNNPVASDLTTATTIKIPATQTFGLTSESGSFVGAIPSSVTFFSPIAVNPGNNLTSQQLWSVMVGSTTFTFTVNSEVQTVDTASQLTLVGSGTFSDGNPADSASGTYQLGFGVTQTTFSFQDNNQFAVPDGGTTAMLLGSALTALGLLKKKFIA